MISKIEVQFHVPVDLPKGWEQRLDILVKEVCTKYTDKYPGRVMWPSERGSKITYMPMTVEEEKHKGMEFDDSVFYIGVSEREKY